MELKSRKDMNPEFQWDVSHIFADAKAWENAFDEVAKNLEEYEDHKDWKQLIEDSKVFRGVVESVAPSPCSFLLSNDKISEIVGLVKVGDVTCCCLDGYNCDVYKYLKND